MPRISALEVLSSPDSGDLVPLVDVSDTSMASSGTTKQITFQNFLAALTAALSTDDSTLGAAITAAQAAAEAASDAAGTSAAETTRAETAESQRLPIFNIVKYGAVCDGSTDDSAAWLAAVNAAVAAKGGIVYHPGGYSVLAAGTIDIALGKNIEFLGIGWCGNASTSSRVITNSTGSTALFNCQSTAFITFRKLAIQSTSASYTGLLIDFTGNDGSDSSFERVQDCEFAGSSGALTPTGIGLSKCNTSLIANTNFTLCNIGIQGLVGSDYSNANHITGCEFTGNSTANISCPGNAWVIDGDNTFEALHSGAAGGILSTQTAYAVTVRGNWFGDITASGGINVQIDGQNWNVSDNYIGFNSGNTGVSVSSGSDFFKITNNAFVSGGTSTGISFAGTPTTYDIGGNTYSSVTTTQPNVPFTQGKSLVVSSGSVLATNATDGFLYIPTCAGTPTGTPTSHTGAVALVFDTNTSQLFVYNGAWEAVTVS